MNLPTEDTAASGTAELPAEIFEQLAQVSTATLQTQLFTRGLRRTAMVGVVPLVGGSTGFVAEAFTLRYIPAREDVDVVESFREPSHPQRVAFEAIPPGHVLVVDSRQDSEAASAGQILMTRLAVRGGAAFVTDGAVRDSHLMGEVGLPVYSTAVTPTTNLVLHHAVDMQVPIGCGGVAVYPGDVLRGDGEGVVVIPRHLAAEVAAAAVEQEHLERYLLGRVRDGASLPGTYPPNDQTRAEYERTRNRQPA